MINNHDGGKGDAKRPLTIDEEQFNKNWDAIFNTDDKSKTPSEDESEILNTIPFGR
jgi:hypothetical protein